MAFDYFNYKSNNKVQKGSILFSQPLMRDKNFSRSVILICEHNNEGSFGYKLNNKIDPGIIKNFDDKNILGSIYDGGPVDLSYLNFIHNHNFASKNCMQIKENIFLGGDYKLVTDRIKLDKKFKYKFFLGYSGWDAGQLEDEINNNSWIVFNEYDTNFLFKHSNDIFWSKFLKKFGEKNKLFSNYPYDPTLN
tara:strand:+ start:362 stop:937 length:576 start_codon:yes stop_codon:yes gene_type:complete